MTNTECIQCQGPLAQQVINANYWNQTGEGKFGGHYTREDFCSMACVKAAPKYIKPAKPKAPKKAAQPVTGDWATLGMFLGHKAKVAK